MIESAEQFLLKCITKHCVDTFDELRLMVYHEKHLQFDIERSPPTSDSIRQHILRAYLQSYIWSHATLLDHIDLDPLNYGYELDEDENLVPIISSCAPTPSNFPQPCNCKKCSQPKVCPCRSMDIPCCDYCKCNSSSTCKNPRNYID